MVDQPTQRQPRRQPYLTDEEIQALACLASGVTHDTATHHLDVSPRTFRRRVRSICDRIGVDTPVEAVVWAAKRELV